jgi:hypothetical protein
MSPMMRAAICLRGPVLASILVLVLATGCARADEVRTERRSVELEGAESVRTDLSMERGDILVGGDAENLMDATFTYNVPQWKPEVSYRGLAERKELTVEQPDVPGPTFGHVRNDWEILLNDEVPMKLSVSDSSGDGNLDLESLSLKNLFLEFSSGDVAADLGTNVNVYVEAQSSSGDINASGMTRDGEAYVNEPYEDSDVSLNLSVQASSGDINLQLAE